MSPPVFTGRRRELEQLTAALDAHSTGRNTTVVISAVGGAGKSWLALRWAHENLERFPDGQLYVNLRGFDPSAEPVPAPVAVRGLLDALGVAPDTVPADPQAQSALYRSLLADRRMLIVLDDAHDADQIRPLLPGSPSCTVLITSRNRLTALVITHGASSLVLGLLQNAQARELLTRQLGEHKVAAEREAVQDLLTYCAGLPLALGIVAARAVAHPSLPLAVLAQELAEAATRLDALDAGDMTVNLRAVFAASHHALTAPARRLGALLGLAPGPDISLAAAASLAAVPHARARVLLAELDSAHLIQQHRPGRYHMHDLVRLYAAELGSHEEDAAAALTRLVDHYLHTAHRGSRIIAPHRSAPDLAPAAPGCAPLALADQEAALEWFAAEHGYVLGVQAVAAEQDEHRKVSQLAYALDIFYWRQANWQDNLTAWQNVLTLLPEGQEYTGTDLATVNQRIGQAFGGLGRSSEAVRYLNRALAIAEEIGDFTTQSDTHIALGGTWSEQLDHRQALSHFRRAARLHGVRDAAAEVAALTGASWSLAQLGEYQEAIVCGEQAVVCSRRDGTTDHLAHALYNLGYVAQRTGDYTRALDYYRQAVDLSRELRNTAVWAEAISGLGDTYSACDQFEEARRAWTKALDFYLGRHRATEAQQIQQKLDALDQTATGPR